MSNHTSGHPFVRPPGSPVYGPNKTALALPRRGPSIRPQRTASDFNFEQASEARRQIADLLAVIRAAEQVAHPDQVSEPVQAELSVVLHKMEQEVAAREQAVADREKRLADRERDLAEAEVLLKHHEALMQAAKKKSPIRTELSSEERTALVALKTELDRQEKSLNENREALREREKFIEDSESRLFEKVQMQQEKETELEQREEDVRLRETNLGMAGNQKPEAKKIFDEFNE